MDTNHFLFYYTSTRSILVKQGLLLMYVKMAFVPFIGFCGLIGLFACTLKEDEKNMRMDRDRYATGRLTAKPASKTANNDFLTDEQPLKLDGKRDGLLYVPKTYHPDRPASLAVMLHGAGGQAEHGLSLLRKYADEYNIILLAPASRKGTWDIITDNSFGADVRFLDQALTLVFERYHINSSHIAIGGFSDGASYALCLGLSNGDLFTHIIAFSPGFVYTVAMVGKPNVFISHGTKDHVLPIGPCSRRIVPQLKKQEIEVKYMEFDGEHIIPTTIAENGVEWFSTKSLNKP